MTITLKSNPDGVSGAIQVNGNDAVVIGTQGITQGAPFSFRNKIINGGCVVAQYGITALANNSRKYGGCDRIATTLSGFTTASGNVSQASGVQTPTTYAQWVSSLTTTGTGYVSFDQRIEAVNTRDLNGQTASVTAWVYQDTGSAVTMSIQLYKPNSGADNYSGGVTAVGSAVSQSVPSGTWTKITGQISIGATDASFGLDMYVQSANFGAVTGKSFYCSGVQLEAGLIATPFEHRPYGTELALCQRYYYAATIYQWLSRPTDADPNLKGNTKLAQTMRAIPTVTNTASVAVTPEIASTDYITWNRGGSGVAIIYTFTASAEP